MIGLVSQTIIPQSLGPHNYGIFTFLHNVFTSSVRVVEMGVGSYFHIKIGKEPYNRHLIGFYSLLVGFVFCLALAFLFFIWVLGDRWSYFASYPLLVVGCVLFMCAFHWVSENLIKISDARALTVRVEGYRFLHRLFWLIGIIFIWWMDFFSLISFTFWQMAMGFILVLWLVFSLQEKGQPFLKIDRTENLFFLKDCYKVISPLLIYSLLSVGMVPLESAILVHFTSYSEQGYFGLAAYMSSIAFLFTNSMVPLLMREFSQAVVAKNYDVILRLLHRSLRVFYFISMGTASFLVFHTDHLIDLFGGERFENAIGPLSLLLFYPAHQSYSQITNTLLFSQEKIKLYTTVGYLNLALNGLLTYFFLFPQSYGGLNLGAFGQSLKYLLIQVVTTNLGLYFCLEGRKKVFLSYIRHQILVPLLLLPLGFICRYGWNLGFHPYVNMAISGGFYALVFVLFFLFFPSIAGLDRPMIESMIFKIKGIIRRRH